MTEDGEPNAIVSDYNIEDDTEMTATRDDDSSDEMTRETRRK